MKAFLVIRHGIKKSLYTYQKYCLIFNLGILNSWDSMTLDGPITSVKLFSIVSEAAKAELSTAGEPSRKTSMCYAGIVVQA